MRNFYLIGLFLTSVILFSCNKDKGLPAPAYTYYIDSRINNKSLIYEDSIRGVLNSTEKTSIDSVTFVLIKESSVFSGTTINGITVNTVISQYRKGSMSDTTLVDSMFTVRSYDFTNKSQNEGIEISWNDGTQIWSSSNGKADQRGSSFEIIKHEYSGKPTFKYISTGNFKCKIYSTDGQSKSMMGNFKFKTNHIN